MLIKPKRYSEAMGLWVGGLVAPVFAMASWMRQARVFHAKAIHFRATTTAAENVDQEFTEVATQLAKNDALVRFSTGMARRDKAILPDVLGISIRFGAGDRADNYQPRPDAQDLLMITAKSPFTLVRGAIATDQENFAGNVYHGGAPFEVGDQPDMLLRLVPLTHVETSGTDRYQNLRQSVDEGDVTFRLEAAKMSLPTKWYPLVEIRLTSEVLVDERELEFNPFRIGRGIVPQGFIQYMRPVPYALCQYARNA